MKIDMNHAEYWSKKQFDTACPWPKLDLGEQDPSFETYQELRTNKASSYVSTLFILLS